ncbi:DHA2 family efflux MFS transporter permease subunit [Frankia sp. AgB32]|uniref:DHA2 family efflux MFS transporter permease subunit n=1 Tax=Frankia sp. AgB32 TaxID=631119 RepID=UPI00200E87D3|nr:DHA2 family efflux MFS transporter permease subunit [Frankia sp. AgB32]MCK9895449.1 DHA2 family efflux MFS transporter permease subunit [Frankia sp. AgB32]
MTEVAENRLDAALRRMIVVTLLGGIMGVLDGSMAALAVDTLASRFHASLAAIGWVSTGYLLALTITIPVGAWAADRFGARRLWLTGLIVFFLGSVGSGLAWNVEALIFFRLVQGVGAGIVDPLMLTLLARAAGPARMGRVMGLMGIVGSTGPIAGPIIGGLILSNLSWRWMFLVNVPIVIVAFALAVRVLPKDRSARGAVPSRPDVVGVALIGPGVAAGVLALSQTAQRGTFASWQAWLPLVVAAVLLGIYAVHALRPRRTPPLIDLRLFARPSFGASVVAAALLGLVTFGSIFAIPLYYQQVRGHGAFESGLLLAPFGFGSALVMPLAGRLSDRLGSRRLALLGASLALIAALGITQFDASTPQWLTAIVAFVLGTGTGTAGAPVIGSVYRTLPPELVPQGSSVLYMLNQLGASIGIALVALIVQTADSTEVGFQHAYVGIACAAVVLIGAASLIPGRSAPQPVVPEQAPEAVPVGGSVEHA